MGYKKLISPEFKISTSKYEITSGMEVECFSSREARSDWCRVELTTQLQNIVTYEDMEECISISREDDEMSDMLEVFVKKTMEKEIKENYPHIQNPPGMYAKVVRVTETAGTYTCVLKILDKTMNTNEDFPEIPGVKTDIAFEKGDIAVVLLLYGGSGVFILGRYET